MYDAVETFLQALPEGNETDGHPLSQAMNTKLPNVQFYATTGKIQFGQSDKNFITTAINRPVFVACTDNDSLTHPVGEYDFPGGYSSPSPPPYHPSTVDSLDSCIKK
jgi:hypothetical protein